MKLRPSQVRSFLRRPDPSVRAVLVYGSDNGQVREVLNTLTAAIVVDHKDPFRVSELTAAAVRTEPALLADAVTALTLTGGRRVVRIHEADDTLANVLESFVAIPYGDALVIAAAADLSKASKLRRLFEGADTSALAIPCYPDEAQTLEPLIHDVLQQSGIRGEAAALAYLVERLGGDRLQSRRELEKLALYVEPDHNTVTLADAMACIGDSTELTLNSLAVAVADGEPRAARMYERLILEGVTPVGMLRALARYFRQLHLATGIMARKHCSAEQAMAILKPQPFFKIKERFLAQILAWPESRLTEVLDLLLQAEMDCKVMGIPSQALCSHTLLQLVQMGAALLQRPDNDG
ncbi:DNA polymerase III delta subunit [invertebrate metagenome]|uniref:DNA-directed DNA polymerase n=1 Tax=invertebrate metagenome TaxID=1711999 RepID=A0A484H5A0_9ZZZZ